MRRILVPVLTAGFAAALTIAGPASGASASVSVTGTASCPSGYLCVWDQTSYNGNIYKFSGTNKSWTSWAINDHDASWYNHGTSGLKACIWGDEYSVIWGWGGGLKSVASGTSSPSDSNRAYKGSSNSWGNC
ncbi:peptidase inhibitor family I36 protein [Streptomyces sp. NPDC001142]